VTFFRQAMQVTNSAPIWVTVPDAFRALRKGDSNEREDTGRLVAVMRADPAVHEVLAEAERSVLDGETAPAEAAEHIVEIHLNRDA